MLNIPNAAIHFITRLTSRLREGPPDFSAAMGATIVRINRRDLSGSILLTPDAALNALFTESITLYRKVYGPKSNFRANLDAN
jgi:hypothetical protein